MCYQADALSAVEYIHDRSILEFNIKVHKFKRVDRPGSSCGIQMPKMSSTIRLYAEVPVEGRIVKENHLM